MEPEEGCGSIGAKYLCEDARVRAAAAGARWRAGPVVARGAMNGGGCAAHFARRPLWRCDTRHGCEYNGTCHLFPAARPPAPRSVRSPPDTAPSTGSEFPTNKMNESCDDLQRCDSVSVPTSGVLNDISNWWYGANARKSWRGLSSHASAIKFIRSRLGAQAESGAVRRVRRCRPAGCRKPPHQYA